MTAFRNWAVIFLTLVFVAMTGCSNGGPGLLNGDFYVRAGSSGIGTVEAPYGSVQDAINAASAPAKILVAAGTYTEDIVLKDGISLHGGCNADFTDRLYGTESNRENAIYRTIIESTRTSGGTAVDPETSFLCNGGIGAATIVEGFTILGGSADVDAAVLCVSGASPTLRNNTISGYFDTAVIPVSYALCIMESSPVVEDNVIIGRDGGCQLSVGIYCNSNPSAVTIQGNAITGSSATIGIGRGIGVLLETSATVFIEDNTIFGGRNCTETATGIQGGQALTTVRANTISAGSTTSSASYGSYGINGPCGVVRNNLIHGGSGDTPDTYGISTQASDIANNTICGGSGSNFSVGIVSAGSPSIRNNIIFTTAAGTSTWDGIGVLENGGDHTDPSALQNNDFFDCPAGLFVNQEGVSWAPTSFINDYLYTTQNVSYPSSGNVTVDLYTPAAFEYFVDFAGPDGDAGTLDDNDWRLTASVALNVRGGGLDLSAEYSGDFEGTTRTSFSPSGAANDDAGGWSMGAYERD